MTPIDQANLLQIINTIIKPLEEANIPYCLLGTASLNLQGIKCQVETVEISIQWDAFEKIAEHYNGEVEKLNGHARFESTVQLIKVVFQCEYNTVVMTDPDRLGIEINQKTYWVKAWDFYLRSLNTGDPSRALIKEHLHELQNESTKSAGDAWGEGAYEAWVNRFGPPNKWAERIKRDPDTRLATLKPYIESIKGKKVINLLGSHGTKAIAMGLLGAMVTVVDISPENARYAKEVADAAGVSLNYMVSDVLSLPKNELSANYDLVFMELGILHYFIDLEPLVQVIKGLLSPGGRVIVQDFHPVSTKLLTSKGQKHKVTGNYFDKSLIETNVAFSKYGDETVPKKVYERKWTLGEIITAFAEAGLFIQKLDEQPNIKINDIGIPKTFTLVAEKINAI